MNDRKTNELHKAGLISRIREISKEIAGRLAAGELKAASGLASQRLQLIGMARASGCNIRKIQAAI